MSNEAGSANQVRAGRGRWFQFSLRAVLSAMVLLAVALGWLSDRAKLKQQLAAERAEKDALRAARDYSDSSMPFWPGVINDGTSSTIWLSPTGEADEATVEHLKDYLSAEPTQYAPVSGNPWVYRGGYGDGSSILLSEYVLRSSAPILTGVDLQGGSLTRVVQDVGPKDAQSLPALLKLLNDPDGATRARAACTLARMGPQAKDAVPALVARVTDAERGVRFHAAYALGRIRENREEVVAALREAMNYDQSFVAAFAAQMLSRIDPSVAVAPRLIELLEVGDDATRRRAIMALIDVAARQASSPTAVNDVASAVPRLKKLFADPDIEISKQAMLAVARIVPPAEAHAALGEVVKAGPGADRERWTFASVLWNKLDRQVAASAASGGP
jgi:hypothetical protein